VPARARNPHVNGDVFAVTVAGSKVYVGGSFTRIGGHRRNSIAALDERNAAASVWNPDPRSDDPTIGPRVNALAVSGSEVYVGGQFTSISGAKHRNFAALDSRTDEARIWRTSGTNDAVNALAVSGATVYVGGDFTSISLVSGGIASTR
jgi:trimeric autotransporter adhesin